MRLISPLPFNQLLNQAESSATTIKTFATDNTSSNAPPLLTGVQVNQSLQLAVSKSDANEQNETTLAVAWKFRNSADADPVSNGIAELSASSSGVALIDTSRLNHDNSRVVSATFTQATPIEIEQIETALSQEQTAKHISDRTAEVQDLPNPDAEQAPEPPYTLKFAAPADVSLDIEDDLITLTAQNASLSSILSLLSKQLNLNLICSEVGDEKVNVKITDVSLSNTLNSILPLHGYTHVIQNNIIVVTKVDPDKPIQPALQGKQVRVFDLNYVSGTEVLRIVTKLMSPIGSAFVNTASPDNKLQSHEQIVVEDMPHYLVQVEEYLAQVDVPPKQVQVEAHVLQIALTDNCRHGVDFNQMLRVANSEVRLQSTGFATTTNPTSVFRLTGTDLSSVIDVLQSTTDTKTLASPKVTVINGQKSRMQVGGQIGYLMTTTTQTSSLQSVDFLEYGVILTVTPLITAEGDILMNVKPQVSTGRINSTTNLPESETTEVETTVMLKSGEAIIIGGLIKETDSETQNKIPILGDMWLVGRIFQKRSHQKERSEVVITLLPRIISEFTPVCEPDATKIDQAMTPLMHGPLHSNNRTMWEPQLPDSMRRD
jgi:type II secretory pathway component GspD/PulD (secretin)